MWWTQEPHQNLTVTHIHLQRVVFKAFGTSLDCDSACNRVPCLFTLVTQITNNFILELDFMVKLSDSQVKRDASFSACFFLGCHSRSSASVSSNPHLLLSHQPLPGSSIFCPSLAFVSKLLNMRHLMLYVLVTPNENVNIFSGLPSCNSSFHSRHYYSVTNHL